MKAVVYRNFGSTKALNVEEVKQPAPRPHEVLIEVCASSVNSWDWDLVIGVPFIVRLPKWHTPPHPVLGADVAGKVIAIGTKVTRFKIGDHVMGDLSNGNWGAFAEYVCAKEEQLVLKPDEMSFEEAAAIPQAGVLAWQSLFESKQIKPGDHILFNGAGGGVGTIGIQLAKSMGAKVTAVDRYDKLDFLKTLGADIVIDYKTEDFTKNSKHYDLIVDVVAKRTMADYYKCLAPNGVFAVVGGSLFLILKIALFGKLLGKQGKKLKVVVHAPGQTNLEKLNQQYLLGNFKPVIDQCFPLEKTAEAIQLLGDGHVKGKVVIQIKK